MTTLVFGDTVIGSEQFSAGVARNAGGFDRLEIGDSDAVALMLKNDPAFVEALVATRQLGAYFCPINWHFKSEEAGFILRSGGADLRRPRCRLRSGAELSHRSHRQLQAALAHRIPRRTAARGNRKDFQARASRPALGARGKAYMNARGPKRNSAGRQAKAPFAVAC